MFTTCHELQLAYGQLLLALGLATGSFRKTMFHLKNIFKSKINKTEGKQGHKVLSVLLCTAGKEIIVHSAHPATPEPLTKSFATFGLGSN